MKWKRLVVLSIVLAIAALIAWRCVLSRLNSRPRFYADSWNDAVAALREEVGSSLVDAGFWSIPRQPLALAGPCATAVQSLTDKDVKEFKGMSFFVSLDGSRSMLAGRVWSAEAATKPPVRARVARLTESEARGVIAAFRYLGTITPRHDLGDSDSIERFLRSGDFGAASYDTSPAPLAPSLSEDKSVLSAVRARAAARFAEKVVTIGRFQYLREDKDVSALALSTLGSCYPCKNRFSQETASNAIDLLEDYPAASAVKRLKWIEKRRQGNNWLDNLWRIPVIGSLFSAGRSDSSFDVSADSALWTCENLSRKSAAQCVDILDGVAFAKTSGQNFSDCHFIQRWPLEFNNSLKKHWSSLDGDEIRNYLRCMNLCGLPTPEIAQLAAGSQEGVTRARGNLMLYDLAGSGEYLARCLKDLPLWNDLRAVDPDTRRDWQPVYEGAALAYMRNKTLSEIPAALSAGIDKLRPQDLVWNAVSEQLSDEVVAALVTAGGRPCADALANVFRCWTANELDSANEMGIYRSSHDEPIDFLGDTTKRALAESRDPMVADVLLAYIESTSPAPEPRLRNAFVYALAMQGDRRLAAVLAKRSKPAAARESEEAVSSDFEATHEPRPGQPAADTSLAILDLRNAADPLAFLLERSSQGLIRMSDAAGFTLSDKYPAAELEKLLLDERFAKLAGPLYLALCRKREMENAAIRQTQVVR